MRTYLECIPCFFRQLLESARLVGASAYQQKKLIDGFCRVIPRLSLNDPPPKIACAAYGLISRICGASDPYKAIKQKSNAFALRLYPQLKAKVARAHDPLLEAVELAIAGNIIDFGVKNNVNVREELKKILAQEKRAARKKTRFHYARFKRALAKAKTILYLGDNCGETVFDRVLIEEIKKLYPDRIVHYAVKSGPVINDALLEDARFCGLDSSARLIANGSRAPGTVLSLCSKEFKKLFRSADMVISKGQGNFESLSDARRAIFFLFMVKCPVVERQARCRMGDIVLLHCSGRKKNR